MNSVQDTTYFDYAAHTPMRPRVLQELRRVSETPLGNPHNRSHPHGRRAAEIIESSRAQVAALLNAAPSEITFTSGATESNNLALVGPLALYEKRRQIVSCVTEHKSVLAPLRRLAKRGLCELTLLPVDRHGRIDLAQLRQTVTERTALVSLMGANNEIGTRHPIVEIAQIIHAQGALFHCDATQLVGRNVVDVKQAAIDLLSLSGHKIYGPHSGALFVRNGIELDPLIVGGGQQDGRRSGTVDAYAVAGLGTACALAREELSSTQAHLSALTRLFRDEVDAANLGAHWITPVEHAVPGIVMVAFEGAPSSTLLSLLTNVAISAGAACTGDAASHVLTALPIKPQLRRSGLRFSFGLPTTSDDIREAVRNLAPVIEFARSLRRPKRNKPLKENHHVRP